MTDFNGRKDAQINFGTIKENIQQSKNNEFKFLILRLAL